MSGSSKVTKGHNYERCSYSPGVAITISGHCLRATVISYLPAPP